MVWDAPTLSVADALFPVSTFFVETGFICMNDNVVFKNSSLKPQLTSRAFSRFSDILVCLLCHLELSRSSSNRSRQSRNLLSSAPALRASQSSNNRSCIIYAAFATF